MIRNVLIISASGLVLYSREFANAIDQPRLVGSLIRTLIEFSSKSAGVPVTHIALTHGASKIRTIPPFSFAHGVEETHVRRTVA